MQPKNYRSNQEGTHPICPACGVPMWLVQIEVETTRLDRETHTFECKACGKTVVEGVKS